jgi:hypothetical protein
MADRKYATDLRNPERRTGGVEDWVFTAAVALMALQASENASAEPAAELASVEEDTNAGSQYVNVSHDSVPVTKAHIDDLLL